jgi:predicted metal-dependent HD superfamily phosphohydrolase
MDDENDQFVVADLVADAIDAHAQAVKVVRSTEFDANRTPPCRTMATMPATSVPRHPAHDALLGRWADLLRRNQLPGSPGPVAYGENLLGRWAEPHRRYHTTDHLLAVLDHAEALAAYAETPDAVLFAAWFHDAVYRPDRSENEERSAALAERALTEAGVDEALVAEVARLVRLTTDHDPVPGDRNGEVLCDADLAMLAGSPQGYAAYAAAVREEYAFVPDDAFRTGRAEVLRQLLALKRLFRTPYGEQHWEHTARRNLSTELDLLSAA